MGRLLNLNLREITAAKADFLARYKSKSSGTPFASDIKINWLLFLNTVRSGIEWRADQTVLRFIHRYFKDQWYLTMECCHVAQNGLINNEGARFNLKNNAVEREFYFKDDFDTSYFNGVTYNDRSLIRGKHVNYLMLPWHQEIFETAKINGIDKSEDASIIFSSCSFDFSGELEKARVRWPHTLAFYFTTEKDGVLLDDNLYNPIGKFVPCKAYDYAYPCPNLCSIVDEWPLLFDLKNPYKNTTANAALPPIAY